MPIVPDEFGVRVRAIVPNAGSYFTSLLYGRGWRDLSFLAGWMDPERYVRQVPETLREMAHRLESAIDRGSSIVVWGDGSADGVMTTAILVDGLKNIGSRIDYVMGDLMGDLIGDLMGSLLNAEDDPFVIVYRDVDNALIENSNPRFLHLNPYSDAMDGLAGTAIAFELLEQLELKVPLTKGDLGGSGLSPLLDLVAIGLLSDPAIAMMGEHRYLVQKGIRQLQRQEDAKTATRPGIQRMLEHCKEQGDRATDIGIGIGPRIAAMSRIQPDGRSSVELLLTQNKRRAIELADLTELAHVRRRGLQREVMDEVMRQMRRLDLSMVPVIVLSDPQWELGALGYVAEELVEIYNCPVLLFNTALDPKLPAVLRTARGVARARGHIDFRALLQSRMGLIMTGNPYAPDLVIKFDHLTLFTESITQQFSNLQSIDFNRVDLCVTIAELNQSLFDDLKRLEPYGRENPTPRILVRNVWFETVRNQKLRDQKNQPVNYVRSTFTMCDDTTSTGISGVWWGHYADDFPIGRTGAIGHLVNNRRARRYEFRLVKLWKEGDVTGALLAGSIETPIPMQAAPISPIAPLQRITTLIGMAKYAARTGRPMPPLNIPKSCEPIALLALENIGFQILQDQPVVLQYGARDARPSGDSDSDRPSKTTLDNAIRPLLLALQEEQFQEQFRSQNQER